MYTEFKGFIASIDLKKHVHHFDKYRVLLKMHNRQSCFIDFRSQHLMERIQTFRPGEQVTIKARMETHVSPNSGVEYNNIIAETINRNTN